MKHRFLKCGAAMIAAALLGMTGCAAQKTDPADETVSFADFHANCTDTMGVFGYYAEGKTVVLDYETMQQTSLCSKPNCLHTGEDCIVKRLNGHAPVFSGNRAYYFVDDKPLFEENADGVPELILGSWLCCYDLTDHTEKQLMHLDGGCVGEDCGGMLLHGDTLYYLENTYSRSYDENEIVCGFSPNGGKEYLHAVSLSDLKDTNLGEVYDLDALTEYFPYAPNSGSVSMEGLFNNRIYFNVWFVEESDDPTSQYFPPHNYVICYDLSDGSFHGTPDDYAHIDFRNVVHLSAEHLAIYDEMKQTVSVYAPDGGEPVVLSDERFQDYADYAVFNDTLFCYPKAFDLNSNAVYGMTDDKYQIVVAAYGGDYICTDVNYASFKKIPAEQLLQP